MEIGFVSSVYVLSIFRILEDMGLDRNSLMDACSTDQSQILNPKFRIPMECLSNALDYASSALDEPNIGLQVGYRFRVHTFTETGSVLALCSTVVEAARINAFYQPLAETMGKCTVEVDGDASRMVWTPYFDDINKHRHVTELVVTGYVTTANWLCWGFGRGVDRVNFMHQQPDSLKGYEEVLGPKFKFEQARNTVDFNPDLVSRRLPMANPEQLSYVRQRLDVILQRSEEKSGIRERVAMILRDSIRDGQVSFPAVAREMGMSERNLRRVLAEENASYRDILMSVRKSLCQTYMKDGRNFTEIAQLLAYNDQSAFTRAFRSWYGVKPTDFRTELLEL